jgi:hypothetical protein
MKRKWKKANNQPKTPPKPLEETITGQRLILFEAFSHAILPYVVRESLTDGSTNVGNRVSVTI